MGMKHIVACVPFARDFVYRQFFMSWTGMLFYAKEKYDLSLVVTLGPYIGMNRDILIEQAAKKEPDGILFLDDDQTYPANTPEILMNLLDENHLIVGGITPIKDSCQPMIWIHDPNDVTKIYIWESLYGQKGMVKVSGMGMGGVMIHPSVFEKIEKPYFSMENKSGKQGEDVSFYLKCEKANIDVWANLDLQYGHLWVNEHRLND